MKLLNAEYLNKFRMMTGVDAVLNMEMMLYLEWVWLSSATLVCIA